MARNMRIVDLADFAEAHLRNKHYADSTIMSYRYVWNQLNVFAKLEGVSTYSFEYGLRFAKLHYKMDFSKLTPPFSERHHHVYRALSMLDEYQQNRSLSACKRPPKELLPEPYRSAIESYLAAYGKNVKQCSVEDAAYTLRKFSEFLYKAGVKKLDDITASDICDFATSLKDYAGSTRNAWLAKIKNFFNFSYQNGFATHNLSAFVLKPRYMPSPKLPSTYSREEIERLLAAVDRANPMGKRDYAILKLAACLGMRSGDIVNLKYENIDWGKNTIRIEQQKSGQPHTLPLLNDVGESIVDYLKNGRPQSNLKHIFLKHCAPYTELTAAALHPIMKKYRLRAKLPGDVPRKSGLHALRHSLASALLEDGTPLPMISEVLGHQKTETTRIYMSIDISGLRKCALEVPMPIMIGE